MGSAAPAAARQSPTMTWIEWLALINYTCEGAGPHKGPARQHWLRQPHSAKPSSSMNDYCANVPLQPACTSAANPFAITDGKCNAAGHHMARAGTGHRAVHIWTSEPNTAQKHN